MGSFHHVTPAFPLHTLHSVGTIRTEIHLFRPGTVPYPPTDVCFDQRLIASTKGQTIQRYMIRLGWTRGIMSKIASSSLQGWPKDQRTAELRSGAMGGKESGSVHGLRYTVGSRSLSLPPFLNTATERGMLAGIPAYSGFTAQGLPFRADGISKIHVYKPSSGLVCSSPPPPCLLCIFPTQYTKG